MKRWIVILFFSFLSGIVTGQNIVREKCMTTSLSASSEDLPVMHLSRKTQERGLREIPVVVHILWHTEAENISRIQVLSQIAALNRDFSAQSDDIEFIPEEYRDLSVDSGLRFYLADSIGGIERRYTAHDTVGMMTDSLNRRILSKYSLGGLDPWDSGSYLNIWVGRMPKGVLGYAFSEWGGVYGVVIDPDVFGTVGTVVQRPRNMMGKTTTHEIGHLFGLSHIWGGGCALDDGIEDTPPQKGPTVGCPSWPEWSCGTNDMYMNFMDYSDDECLTMFTKGQINRMHDVISFRFPNLGTVTTMPAPTGQITIFPNPVKDYLTLFLPDESPVYEVGIFSLPGRQVYKKNVAAGYLNIPVTDWPHGVYLVVVTAGQKRIVKKVVR